MDDRDTRAVSRVAKIMQILSNKLQGLTFWQSPQHQAGTFGNNANKSDLHPTCLVTGHKKVYPKLQGL